MNVLKINKTGIGLIVALGIGLIVLFTRGLYSPLPAQKIGINPSVSPGQEEVKVVSMIPANLNGSTININQEIALTFNYPIDEADKKFELFITPDPGYKLQMSSDKKTVKVILNKSFELGQTYGIHISNEAPFQGKRRLKDDLDYTFHTITYSGV